MQGVAGIGIVNAVEVVHAFGKKGSRANNVGAATAEGGTSAGGSGEGAAGDAASGINVGLKAFREWLEAPNEGLIAAAARITGGDTTRDGPMVAAAELSKEGTVGPEESGESVVKSFPASPPPSSISADPPVNLIPAACL